MTAASTPTLPYYLGKVTEVAEEKRIPSEDNLDLYTQRIQVRRQDTDEVIELPVGSDFQPINADQRLKPGMRVVLSEQTTFEGQQEYVLADVYRLPILSWLAIGFFVLVALVARRKGIFSIIGMAASLWVLAGFIVPSILHGGDPVWISLVGSTLIAGITMYLSHGFARKTHIALFAMMLTLLAVALLAQVAVRMATLVGLGSEEAYFLQFGAAMDINLQGLLLGGIILGALGILDDITTSQVSVVNQLAAVNQKMSFAELYQRGMEVGRDHVASLVNTLVLAYAAANLPLFLLFTLASNTPLWVTVNTQVIAEEVVRTLVGSMGLVLAVPFTTLLAALAFRNPWAPVRPDEVDVDGHHHH